MAAGGSPIRLVTYASLEALTPPTFWVRLRHVARLPGGREVLLLDDRGFGGGMRSAQVVATREQIERDARTCVGPDESVGQQTPEQVDEWHRERIAGLLGDAGVSIGVDDVGRLEHEVVLDERLQAHLAR